MIPSKKEFDPLQIVYGISPSLVFAWTNKTRYRGWKRLKMIDSFLSERKSEKDDLPSLFVVWKCGLISEVFLSFKNCAKLLFLEFFYKKRRSSV